MTNPFSNFYDVESSRPIPSFDLMQEKDYLRWRQQKLAHYPTQINDFIVPIQDFNSLSRHEHARIQECIQKANFAVYQLPPGKLVSKLDIQSFGQQLGLYQLDHNLCADEESISTLRAIKGKNKHYIPYTNQALSWHTDGYYNKPEHRVRSFILHCVRAAASGGENALLDPEIVYIHLRDLNPEFVDALMHAETMTIPANEENGKLIRASQSGPVFSVDPFTQQLHMRYTARTRSIEWRNDPLTADAVKALEDILITSKHILSVRLQAGQGIISNNVLHNRAAFVDDKPQEQIRLMYRARYYDRIRGQSKKLN